MPYSRYNRSSNAYSYDYVPSYQRDKKTVVPAVAKRRNEIVINNQRRAGRMNLLVVLKISVGAALLMAACCALVYFYTDLGYLKRSIADKEKEYNVLVRENEDFRNDITKNVNIASIKKKAKKLGMKNAKKKNIQYYATCCEEFVMQIEEFPEK